MLAPPPDCGWYGALKPDSGVLEPIPKDLEHLFVAVGKSAYVAYHVQTEIHRYPENKLFRVGVERKAFKKGTEKIPPYKAIRELSLYGGVSTYWVMQLQGKLDGDYAWYGIALTAFHG